ncbi:putative short-chain dehydrogenase/reductase [Xylaria sp. FL1777]|nr:putative short-chain dehydrogenase/reductase [Xylaria sp. FL1777]
MPLKTALVTGCSAGGLGAAIARSFQEAGFHVFATVRDPSKVCSSLTNAPNVEVLPLDVTSAPSITACATHVSRKTGGTLDVLVNNAGGGFIQPLLHTSIAEGKEIFDVNVWGILAMAQACAPLLVEAKGAMVNISSIGGTNPVAWQGIYNSSKAAATFLSETLRFEMEPLGVRVVTAMVGSVKTEIYSKKKLRLPDDSWYKSIEKIMERQARGELQEPTNETADVTAANIVRDTVNGARGKIWRGGKAGMVSYTSWLLPTVVIEWMMQKPRGLPELRAECSKTRGISGKGSG